MPRRSRWCLSGRCSSSAPRCPPSGHTARGQRTPTVVSFAALLVPLLATLETAIGEPLPHLGNALVSGARRSATVLESSLLNPRRHPWTFCFAFAFSSWHSFVAGVPRD